MKVIFEFQRPEDNEELNLHLKASDYHSALYDFSLFLRNKTKYENLTEEEHKRYVSVKEEFYKILNEYTHRRINF
jgi:hypothetical protein